MSDYFIGEIRVFGFNFAPSGWAMCQGQTMQIQQNAALYSLLGTRYGGNGSTNFLLPDLRGRVPISQGLASTGTNYVIGAHPGTETVTLTTAQASPHTHSMAAVTAVGTTAAPAGLYFSAVAPDQVAASHPIYAAPGNPPAAPLAVNPATVASGGGGAHNNMQPFLVLNFCIALSGLFPPQQ